MRKNTWYAIYHQRELDYLARSYQPGYFFILMGGIDLTDYLPIDGSKPMTGNLASLNIIPIADNLYACGSGWGTGRWKIIETVTMNIAYMRFRGGTGGAYTHTANTSWFSLYSYDTAMRECIKLINGIADLLLVGGGNLPLADPADGKCKLWNDVGTVKVGT